MDKKEIIRQMLQAKDVVLIHRFDKRLYIEATTFIRNIGYHNVTIVQDGFEIDLAYSSLSDTVLDLIIKELQK
jgi:thermostable 8-oxoguanine DNA glycosylase